MKTSKKIHFCPAGFSFGFGFGRFCYRMELEYRLDIYGNRRGKLYHNAVWSWKCCPNTGYFCLVCCYPGYCHHFYYWKYCTLDDHFYRFVQFYYVPPNIFSLAVKDLDNAELSGASGLINALILGGAILPPLMGAIADTAGYTYAFLVPAVSYLFIFYYAVSGSKIRRKLENVIDN